MGNAVILAEKRTGSTFLQEALRSHPDIKSEDELLQGKPGYGGNYSKHGTKLFKTLVEEKFGDNRQDWPIIQLAHEYLDELFESAPNVVFRFMYPQHDEWIKWYKMDLFGYFEGRRIPVIHLRRRNWLKTVLSMEMKHINRQAITGETIEKVILDPHELGEKIVRCMKKYMRFEEKAKKVVKMELLFEDILGKTKGLKEDTTFHGDYNIRSNQMTYVSRKANRKLCKFFGVKRFRMHTNISQISDPDMWKYVENKDQIIKYMAEKGLKHMCE